MGGWSSIDDERAPSAGLGMAALIVGIGLLLLGIGWLAVVTFLSIVSNLSHLA